MPKKKTKRRGNAGGKNRTKFTQKARLEFLENLRGSANVTLSARGVFMSRRGVYNHKEANQKFSDEWDNAIEEAVDTLEAEARRRAFHGVERPVHYKGQRVDMIREYSDGLMMFLLKAHRPHKYRDKYEISGPDDGPIEIREIRRIIVDA